MKIGIVEVGLLAVAVIVFLILQCLGQRRDGGAVASHEEIKGHSRAGEVSL